MPKTLFGMLIIGQKENVDNVSILYTALLVKIHYYDFFMLAQADHMKLIIFHPQHTLLLAFLKIPLSKRGPSYTGHQICQFFAIIDDFSKFAELKIFLDQIT